MIYNQLTSDEFVKRAKNTHGNFYDYSKSKYEGYHAKIEIVCPLHGKFLQRAKHHIEGRGCRKCANDVLRKKYTFWDDAKDAFLKNNFEKMSYAKIAKVLKCCRSTVYKRKKELFLKRKEKPQHAHIPNYVYIRLKKGAEYRKIDFEITKDDIWGLFIKQNRKCALTGCDIIFSKIKGETTASVDRIDSKKIYTLDNIQIVHKDINRLKMAFPVDVFISMCKKVSDNFKNKKRKIVRWDIDILNDTEYPVFSDKAW
jgi:hypothetical protein